MLTELQERLYLVYTPAYDPDANRSDFALLLAVVETHFQALAQTPAAVLRHIGSPFAPVKDHDAPLSLAQAA